VRATSKDQLDPPLVVQLAPVTPVPSTISALTRSSAFPRADRDNSTVPPLSFREMCGFKITGTGTGATDSAAGGENRYSISAKRPSGGTNDKDLSRVQRWSLQGFSKSWDGNRGRGGPDACMEAGINKVLHVRKAEEQVGCPGQLRIAINLAEDRAGQCGTRSSRSVSRTSERARTGTDLFTTARRFSTTSK
jgi:hypothetical protein